MSQVTEFVPTNGRDVDRVLLSKVADSASPRLTTTWLSVLEQSKVLGPETEKSNTKSGTLTDIATVSKAHKPCQINETS